MSDVAMVEQVSEPVAGEVSALIEHAAGQDGQAAVSEQGRLHLRGGRRAGVTHFLVRSGGALVGYGQLEDADPVEAPAAEFVVHPGHRGNGYGRALGRALLDASGRRMRVWAHGGHAAARHLAQTLGMTLFRELRQMRAPLDADALPQPVLPPGVELRAFRPGRDEEHWLAANAAAFAHHPEQGALTRRDLDARMAEPWFDPRGFLLAVPAGEPGAGEAPGAGDGPGGDAAAGAPGGPILGFHWTKVHSAEGLGEVYVVGVVPGAQGGGLGKALTVAGLRHLAEDRGLSTGMLYVDADNGPAVSVYERLGFRVHEVDLMYRTEG